MYWAMWDETNGITENGTVEVMPFRSVLGYDNLDVSGYFLQEEKNLFHSISQNSEKQKKSLF